MRCIFVEKKNGYDIEGKSLLEDFKNNLGITSLENVRLVNKYTLNNVIEEEYKKSLYTIFSEKTVDNLYENEFPLEENEIAFGVEFLPGQYDQRADSASECYQILTSGEKIKIKWTKIIVLKGNLSIEEIEKIKKYYINPVDSIEVDINNLELSSNYLEPKDVEILNDFINLTNEEIEELHINMGLAMSIEDIKLIQEYFKNENRNPTITEIKVIDTYWSDHCRHTTFQQL